MGILDFLFKKNKPAQPSQPFRAPNATLSELAQRAEEAKRKEIDAALPEVEASAHRIRSQWSHLEKKTVGLAKKPVRSGIDGEKVAEQSRDAFARRTEQLFKSSVFPEARASERERDIESFSRFARDFEEVLHKFARALSDNKYLFLFFKEDTEEIGRSINELNDEALTLKHSVEAAHKNSEKYATLLRRIGELEALRGKNAEFEQKARSAEEEVARWTEKEKQAQTEFALEEKNAAQSKIEIAALDNDAWTAENEITQLIAPLQRPFRKLEKLLESRETRPSQEPLTPRAHVDKQLLYSLASYAANLILALENDAESNKLAAACAELEKNVTELNFDLKDSEKIQEACDAVRGGKIRSLWSVRTDALRRKEQKSEALAPLEKAKAALEDASEHRQEASLAFKAAQAKLAENAAAIRLEKDAINKAANSLFKLSLRE